MLHELTGEQIGAIGAAVAAIITALGALAYRSANRAVAPVSGSADAVGLSLIMDPKRLDLAIQQLGVIEIALRDHKRSIDENNRAVDRGSDTSDRVMRSFNALHDVLLELRDDLRESRIALKADSDAVREDLRAYRASTRNEREGYAKEVREEVRKRLDPQD